MIKQSSLNCFQLCCSELRCSCGTVRCTTLEVQEDALTTQPYEAIQASSSSLHSHLTWLSTHASHESLAMKDLTTAILTTILQICRPGFTPAPCQAFSVAADSSVDSTTGRRVIRVYKKEKMNTGTQVAPIGRHDMNTYTTGLHDWCTQNRYM